MTYSEIRLLIRCLVHVSFLIFKTNIIKDNSRVIKWKKVVIKDQMITKE